MRLAALALSALLPAALPGGRGVAVARGIPPFPSGLDWPCSASDVERWVAQKDVARIRRHGWYLWAGLNTLAADGRPIWISWPTVTRAFAPDTDSGAPAARAKSLVGIDAEKVAAPLSGRPYYPIPEPVRVRYRIPDDVASLPDGDVFESSGHIMLATVAYDQEAFSAIRAQGLYRRAELARRAARGDRDVGGFPPTSIVIKHMYWPVRGDGPSALPVWDDAPPPPAPVYAGYETWKRAVAIDPTGRLPVGSKQRVTLLHGVWNEDGTPYGPVAWDAGVVPLDRFYTRTLAQADLGALGRNDRALLDAAAFWAYGRLFALGDRLVSVAMHINTAEQPGWTFQSLWWHDRSDQGPYAEDRPDIPEDVLRGPWRHYLMASTYGILSEPQAGQPPRWPLAYNPFIELALGHPIDTNCIACHARAGWPGGSGRASYDDGPGRLDVMKPEDAYFERFLRTQDQWAIPDRAVP